MKKLLIVEHSNIIANEAVCKLQAQWDITIAHNADEAIDYIKQRDLDAMVLDLFLPDATGFDVLSECFPHLPHAIVATTAILDPDIERQAARWGVDYVFQKPIDPVLISDYLGSITELQQYTTKQVAQHLRVLGFSAGIKGYNCLLLAIAYLKADLTLNMQKEVYAKVAESLQLDPRAVEKAIRTCIQTTWSRRYCDIWKEYFPVDQNGQLKCPTNKEFITCLALKV